MTGRFCEVHGEYAADGVCRWCEPALPRVDVETRTNPAPTAPAWQAKVKDMTPCRCGEYSWTGSREERNAVIAGVAHSPEQCFKLDAEPPAVDAYGESPGARALRDVKLLETYGRESLERIGYDWTRGPEVDTPEKLARIANVDETPPSSAVVDAMNRLWLTLPGATLRSWMRPRFSTRQRYSTPEGIASHNAFWEGKLAEEHAALRWERVARRWETKHPSKWMKLDSTDMDDFAQRMVDAFLRWFYGLEPKP